MNQKRSPVAIVGAGWAGLATAIKLAQQGIPVSLFEAATTAGGRARDIQLKKIALDNGQHLMIGGYQHVLAILDTVGVDINTVFERRPLSLQLIGKNAQTLHFQANPYFPAPLHLLAGLLGKTGMSLKHRFQIARLSIQLLQNPESIADQRNVQDWLGLHGQDEEITRWLWEPLCLAILNTPIKKASARTFLRVLKDSFLYKRKNSDLLFSTSTLSKLFVDPCLNFLNANDAKLHLGQRVTGLTVENNRVSGLNIGDKHLAFKHVILAVPPNHCHNLTASHPQLGDLNNKLSQFTFEPITTVYLQYPRDVQLPQPMIGLVDSYSQWIFDRRICNQPGLMSVVISSSGPHMKLDRQQLADLVIKEIAYKFPALPKPRSSFVVREKRATFQCSMNIDAIRPENHTPVQGLWLAADFTDTGYPATLEGAVKSGIECARQVAESL
jgi:squalene-associated FAD-dependent desaturase